MFRLFKCLVIFTNTATHTDQGFLIFDFDFDFDFDF